MLASIRTNQSARRLALYVAVCFCLFFSELNASPVTWQLDDVTFDLGGGQVGRPGPITATGSFVYDADLHQFLTWNINVSGASDTTLDFNFTSVSSFIPSINLTDPNLSIVLIRTLPGNPPENVFGDSPFDSNSVMIELNFFESNFNLGLTDAGGTIDLENGGTFLFQIATSTHYYVRTGAVSTVPEPSSFPVIAIGIFFLPFLAKRVGGKKIA